MLERPSHPSRLAVLSIALLGAVPYFASARQASAADLPPLVEEISVEVVNVDIVVTDGAGRPITGLTADDFEVFEDGVRRDISNFFSFRLGHLQLGGEGALGESPAAKGLADSRMRRRMALLFDNNTLEKRHRAQLIRDLERFVLEQFDESYEWSVVAYGNELQLMQPFTSDKTTVLGALGRVGELPVPVRRRRPTDRTEVEQLSGSRRAAAVNPGARGLERGASKTVVSLADFEMRERMLEGLQMFDRTSRAVIQTMRAHMGLDGRKSLILVSGYPSLLPGADQVLGRGFPGVGSGRDSSDPLVNALHGELLSRYEAMIKIANAAGFSIYPVSASRGIASHSSYLDVERKVNMTATGYLTESSSSIDLDGSSRTLATNTGGSFYSTDNFYGAFDDIDDRTSNSYVLGFATDHTPDGRYHEIRVRTKRPGLRLFHRQGYLHLSREDQLAEELATPLAFPKDRGDFEVAIEVVPSEPGRRNEPRRRNEVDVLVAGLVPIEELTLVPQGEAAVGRVHVYIAVYDRSGELLTLVREHQDLRVEADRLAAAPDGSPARVGLTLRGVPKGEYTISVTLIDDVTGRYGTDLSAVRL